MLGFNRTTVELKHQGSTCPGDGRLCFNRTTVELSGIRFMIIVLKRKVLFLQGGRKEE